MLIPRQQLLDEMSPDEVQRANDPVRVSPKVMEKLRKVMAEKVTPMEMPNIPKLPNIGD